MGDVAEALTLFDHAAQAHTAPPMRAVDPRAVVCSCGESVLLVAMREHLALYLCERAPVDADRTANVWSHAPSTSHEARLRALPRTGSKRRVAFDLIRERGTTGMTDDELEVATGWPHQSASACRNSLMHDGWLVDSGVRRPTRYGNDAIAWVVAAT